MDLGIAGRVALVTGASKGLGLGVATALLAEGARVAISSRSGERIASAADTIGARAYVHDAADVENAPALVDAVTRDLGPIEILVTNSGGPPAAVDPLSFSHDQWRAAYESLLLGQLALIEAALAEMRARQWGRVLSVSSSVVREPNPALVLSAAHRSGLLAALKTISREVASDGVTINAVLPGLIATDRLRELGADTPERVAQVPARRLGTVEEFAAAAVFLVSGRASYITGATLLIDGGASRSV